MSEYQMSQTWEIVEAMGEAGTERRMRCKYHTDLETCGGLVAGFWRDAYAAMN